MSDDLIFHTNPISRGRIVPWILEEIGQLYQTEIIIYGDAMK
jgi:glutathione S-transferase